MNRETLYARLPVALQNAACALEGLRVRRSRYGAGFDRAVTLLDERLDWPQEKVAAFRDTRLREFLRHCATTVPYYRRLFRDRELAVDRVRTLDDLAALPVLDKSTVQASAAEIQSEAVPVRLRVPVKTSGTTGAGLHFTTTREAAREQYAVWWRYWRRLGIPRTTWCGYFGGRSVVPLNQTRPPYWRFNPAGRQILFSAYHLSETTAADYVAALRASRPPWLHGYPSVLALLARMMLERRLSLPYTPGWITTGAESLLPWQGDVIRRAFGTSPHQHYGMAEAAANVSQCRERRLHVDEDFAAVEFVPLEDGAGYHVIGTNLSNPSFPLVRYDTGDVVAGLEPGCPCGRAGRVVTAIDGRQEDYIILRNGARLGRMDHIFKDMTAIREAQIVQDIPGVIVARIVRGASYGADDEGRLRDEFVRRVGDGAELRFEYVGSLPRTAAGKLRFVVSSLREGRLRPG